MGIRSIITVCFIVAALAAPLSARAETKERHVLGLVGKIVQKVRVHSSASTRSRTLFWTQPDKTLVVKTEAPQGWMKVLLTSGGYGYVSKDAVELVKQTTEEGTRYLEVVSDTAPKPRAQLVASRGTARSNEKGRAAAAEWGTQFKGTRYVWGGNDLENGIDCSGFVQKLYGAIGENLPRTAAEQAMVGVPVRRFEDLKKGDRLYFWDYKRGKIGHTGLYLGNWRFVHSSSSRGGVAEDDIRDPKWLKILVSARR
jgi:cell wall-associated NlpC family hydrolase